jgi:hypothetical protein
MSSKKDKKSKKVKVSVPFEQRPLLFKVSEKKAVSIYGLNRFPVTLYKDQMIRLLDSADAIRYFIEEHNNELASKKEKEELNEEEKKEEIEIKPF